MVVLQKLWIGDKVKVLENNSIGYFEGIEKTGMARIKIGNTIQWYTKEELEEYVEEKTIELDLDFLEEETRSQVISKKTTAKLKTEIDLHIQILSPEHLNSHPAVIIDVQLEALQNFVQQTIQQKQKSITIIHGKGEGKLKEYVHQYLSTIPQTKWKVLTNKDGATEVWFEYL